MKKNFLGMHKFWGVDLFLKGRRGQLLSADFIIAMVLFSLALGVTTQAIDVSSKQTTFSNNANAIADHIVKDCNYSINESCVSKFENVQIKCGAISTGNLQCSNIVSAQRLALCNGASEILEVKSCG